MSHSSLSIGTIILFLHSVDISSCSYTLCVRLITYQSLLLPNTSTYLLESQPFPLSLLSSFVMTLLFSTSFLLIHSSFGTKTGRNCKPASFLWREESVHNGLVFIGYGMDRNCLKIVYGESVLKQIAKIKMAGSIIGPAGKKKFKKKKYFFF